MRQRPGLILIGFFFLMPKPAQAALSVRECIKGPSSGRWELPGDSVWRTVLTLQFSNVLSSDVIAQAAITYHEGPGQTGVRVEYQLVLDSVSSFTMQHRPQTGFPTAKMLRASFPGSSLMQSASAPRARICRSGALASKSLFCLTTTALSLLLFVRPILEPAVPISLQLAVSIPAPRALWRQFPGPGRTVLFLRPRVLPACFRRHHAAGHRKCRRRPLRTFDSARPLKSFRREIISPHELPRNSDEDPSLEC